VGVADLAERLAGGCMAARCVDSISSNLSPTPVLAKLVQILAPLRVFYQDTASSGRFIEARHSAMLNSILLEWAEQTKKIRYTQHSLQSLFPGKTAALLPFKLATTEDEHAKRSENLAAASASVAASAADTVTDMQGKCDDVDTLINTLLRTAGASPFPRNMLYDSATSSEMHLSPAPVPASIQRHSGCEPQEHANANEAHASSPGALKLLERKTPNAGNIWSDSTSQSRKDPESDRHSTSEKEIGGDESESDAPVDLSAVSAVSVYVLPTTPSLRSTRHTHPAINHAPPPIPHPRYTQNTFFCESDVV